MPSSRRPTADPEVGRCVGGQNALTARPVHRQQRGQIGQIHVAVAVEITVLVCCPAGHAVVAQDDREVGDVDVVVTVEVAWATRVFTL